MIKFISFTVKNANITERKSFNKKGKETSKNDCHKFNPVKILYCKIPKKWQRSKPVILKANLLIYKI